MAMSINTNVASLNSQRVLNGSQGALNTAMQRLSSGLRVNGAKDDAAGLAVADRMNAQLRGTNAAIRNANDGLGMLQIADSVLGKVTEGLQRIRELAVQGANGTYNTTDYTNMEDEIGEIVTEMNRLVTSAKFNNQPVFGNLSFQVGANTEPDEMIDVAFTAPNIATIAFTSQTDARAAMDSVDTTLEEVATLRTSVGAHQQKFEYTISNLQSTSEALGAARGRIMDADFAVETSNLSRSQVLQQAGTAMLAQANQSAQNVMQLLR